MSAIMDNFLEIAKTIVPWLTGGLAGSILTFTLNQRKIKKNRPMLLIESKAINYSASNKGGPIENLCVTYKNQEYDSLHFYEMHLVNNSLSTIKNIDLSLICEGDAKIISFSPKSNPVFIDVKCKAADRQSGTYEISTGNLKPNDSITISFLISNTQKIEWSWRGDDDVMINSNSNDLIDADEKNIRIIILWIVLYILCGTIDIAAPAARAILILISIPYLLKIGLALKDYLRSKKTTNVEINSSNDCNVNISK